MQNEYPFSAFGTYWTIECEAGRRILRNVRGHRCDLAELQLTVGGVPVAAEATAEPEKLTLTAVGGTAAAEFCFDRAGALRIRTVGAGVRFAALPGGGAIANTTPAGPGVFRSIFSRNGVNGLCWFVRLAGTLEARSEWTGLHANEFAVDLGPGSEAAVIESRTEWNGSLDRRPFAELAAAQRRSFETFLPDCRNADAAYLAWSGVVPPDGWLTRRSMLVSKRRMCGIWSWDHCVNALALATAQPELAFDQFMGILDRLDECGGVPDKLTPGERTVIFVKPPIHGWTYTELMRRNPAFFGDPDRLRAAAAAVARWTDFWFDFRDPYRTGLPLYYHGCDSGWDNAVAFAAPPPWCPPDLVSYLILQLEFLAAARPGEAAHRREQAEILRRRLLTDFWDGTGFRVFSPERGFERAPGDSLLLSMPLLLGKRLPPAVFSALRSGLDRFRTPWGLATENPAGDRYEPAGYWRGPIWAPPMILIASGLADAGDADGARELARSFRRLCDEHGFHENYDARTGAGLCECPCAWSFSGYLTMEAYL